jgi:hypothetical protein
MQGAQSSVSAGMHLISELWFVSMPVLAAQVPQKIFWLQQPCGSRRVIALQGLHIMTIEGSLEWNFDSSKLCKRGVFV